MHHLKQSFYPNVFQVLFSKHSLTRAIYFNPEQNVLFTAWFAIYEVLRNVWRQHVEKTSLKTLKS